MRFWDASAVFALLGGEPRGSELAALYDEDPRGAMWCFTAVEIRSALARCVRMGEIDTSRRDRIWHRLARLRRSFLEVDAVGPVRERAERIVDLHALRAADALQLAAALVVADAGVGRLPFVTLDRRLAEAASHEGFPILPPLGGESIVRERRPRRGRAGSGSTRRSRPRARAAAAKSMG